MSGGECGENPRLGFFLSRKSWSEIFFDQKKNLKICELDLLERKKVVRPQDFTTLISKKWLTPQPTDRFFLSGKTPCRTSQFSTEKIKK